MDSNAYKQSANTSRMAKNIQKTRFQIYWMRDPTRISGQYWIYERGSWYKLPILPKIIQSNYDLHHPN